MATSSVDAGAAPGGGYELPRDGASPSRAGLVAAVALALLVSVPNFIYPYFEDAAHYAVAGRLLGEGLLPYRDTIVQKGPATFWTTYLVDLVLGRSSVAARGFELALILLMAVACARIARRACGPAAMPAGLVVAAILSSGVFWSIVERSQVEWYQAAATAWAVALAVDALGSARPGAGRLIVAGALFGLACWFKPQSALAGAGVWLVLVARALRPAAAEASIDLRGAARTTGLLAAGVIAASLPFVLWMAVTGILDDFWHHMVDYNMAYLGIREKPSLGMALDRAVTWPWIGAAGMAALLALTIAGLLRLALPHKSQDGDAQPEPWPGRWIGAVVAVWFLASFGQYLSGRYLFRYHQVILVPSMAVILTCGVVALRTWLGRLAEGRVRAGVRRAVVVAGALALTIAVLANDKYVSEWRSMARYLAGHVSSDELYARYGRRLHYYYYPTQRALAEHVKARTRPGDTVQLMGRGGTFYLYVDRRPATRFLVTQIIFDKRRLNWEERLESFVRELERARPAYIVIRGDDAFPWFDLPPSSVQVSGEPRVKAFLDENYSVEGLFQNTALILRRNDHDVPGRQ